MLVCVHLAGLGPILDPGLLQVSEPPLKASVLLTDLVRESLVSQAEVYLAASRRTRLVLVKLRNHRSFGRLNVLLG